jgi:hypothetical protein
MPIRYTYKNRSYREYYSAPKEAEPELQNEEIVVESPQETHQYESPTVEPEVEEKLEVEEKEEKNEREWEFTEEDARNIAMVIISLASLFPYWPEKKKELEEKYGSIEEFQMQYEANLQKALSHPWVQKVIRNMSWIQHLTLIPFILQTFELFTPPKRKEEKQVEIANVEIPTPQSASDSTPESAYIPLSKQQIVEGAFTIQD